MNAGETCHATGLKIGKWNLERFALPRHVNTMLDHLVDKWDDESDHGFDRESVLEALILQAFTAEGGCLHAVYSATGVPHTLTRNGR